ncbi:Putative glutamine amidotransferase Rv2859c [Legionella steigerwaltii]|uniref:Glutamine amidotransferase n=1 Tax=Legionella steigerwaltii TaxID=460 RepID=A0A378LC22_9GAMM|nr:gamma-glutamyl-gamma-aminobutyrate hydrolase family protein [Legionella steigerwaltii]KTD80894.1 putative glutamine amidotransferase [Legionella steigerwaltii]STY23418.1 Putative glutamine amidotransferase Rv2859c [Legionella steigerwaltii]
MGFPISQSEFEKILDDFLQYKKGLPPKSKFPLAAYLKGKGYSAVLQNLNFAVPNKTVSLIQMQRADGSLASATKLPRRTNLLNDIDFTGCEIKNCQFDECDLSGSIWDDQDIRDSSFNNTVINHASFHRVRFINNHFTQTTFDYSRLNDLLFVENIFIRTSFNYLKQFHKVTFKECHIQQVPMLGGTSATEVIIRNSPEKKLSKISGLLVDKKIAMERVKKTNPKPAILVSWNNVTPLMSATVAEKMLLAHGMYPVRMDITPKVDAEILEKEVNTLNILTQKRLQQLKDEVLEHVKKLAARAPCEQNISSLFAAEWKKQGISFPLLMIQIMREENAKNPSAFPQMAALYQHAKTIFDQVDGILLTGGQDMDPRFYGEERHPKTGLPNYTDYPKFSDPRRDVLEFCLVYMQQRASAPKPLCGICRGSQVIAASYDATIYQELDSPERRQYLVEEIQPKSVRETAPLYSTSRTLASVIKDEEKLNVLFMHHQGYDLGRAYGVEATASKKTSGGKTIDTVGENLQQNITLVQAHIEYYMDQEEGGIRGFSPFASAEAAESIFKQFQTRVSAYCQNQRLLKYLIPNMFFTTNVVLNEQSKYTAAISANCMA